MKIGVGIPTYNRHKSLARVLAGVYATSKPDIVCVSDDGGTDDTGLVMSGYPDAIYLHNENKGIAHNKNRLLFRLFVVERCDVVILLEDDFVPVREGWLEVWAKSANFFYSISNGYIEEPDALNPDCGMSEQVSAQIWAISRGAFEDVGYLDVKFGAYGYEHVEWQRREALRGGETGVYEGVFSFIVRTPRHFEQDTQYPSTATPEALKLSERVYRETATDQGYKPPCDDWPKFMFECLTAEEKSLIR